MLGNMRISFKKKMFATFVNIQNIEYLPICTEIIAVIPL